MFENQIVVPVMFGIIIFLIIVIFDIWRRLISCRKVRDGELMQYQLQREIKIGEFEDISERHRNALSLYQDLKAEKNNLEKRLKTVIKDNSDLRVDIIEASNSQANLLRDCGKFITRVQEYIK